MKTTNARTGVGMRLFRKLKSANLNEGAPEIQGLAGWMLSLTRGWRGQRMSQQKQLQLVETLALGGKKQLMLVMCAGESFLVGGNLESVETIVRLRAEVSQPHTADEVDEPCC